jgi:mannose-6-phosphate isomerase
LADLPDSINDGRSHVACGPFGGATLRQVIEEHRREILGDTQLSSEGGFPLLVKFLDANEHLSIQVHPDAAYAASHPGAFLKTEAWVILKAEPGAMVFRGIDPTVDRERFFNDLADREGSAVLRHLHSYKVERGDCVYLPSGICHALGAGIVAAEVQTPSDTTFRVFDWNRNDANRPLHVTQARACMRFGSDQEDGHPALVRSATQAPLRIQGLASRQLCATEYFVLEWVDAMPQTKLDIHTDQRPMVWCVIDGSVGLRGPAGRALRLRLGDTVLLPAALEGWSAEFPDRTTVLRTTIPQPAR